MSRLIWVKPEVGGPFLINPAQVVTATVWEAGRDRRPYRRIVLALVNGADFVVPDPDGKLLHLLTDGVPEPPEDVCPRPLPDTGPAAAPGETPSP